MKTKTLNRHPQHGWSSPLSAAPAGPVHGCNLRNQTMALTVFTEAA